MYLTVRMIIAAVAGVLFLWFALRQIDAFFQKRGWTSGVSKAGRILSQYSLVLLVLAILIPVSAIERKIIFVPLSYPSRTWTAAEIPGCVQDVYMTLPSGDRLHGCYIEPNREPGQKPDCYILYFHGNGGNLTYYIDELEGMVRNLNAAVLCVDYSGYGQSEGEPSEYQLYRDGAAAMKKILELSGQRPNDIVVTGMSLGGAVATEIALKMQKSGTPVKALILECTFSSIPRMASELLPMLPSRWLLSTRFDTNSKLREYNGPLFISHGDADRVVSYNHAKLNDQAARTVADRNGPYQFLTIPYGMHAAYFTDEYFDQVRRFLEKI